MNHKFLQIFEMLKYLSLLQLLHDGGPYHMETSPFICSANQWNGLLYNKDLRHEKVKGLKNLDVSSRKYCMFCRTE